MVVLSVCLFRQSLAAEPCNNCRPPLHDGPSVSGQWAQSPVPQPFAPISAMWRSNFQMWCRGRRMEGGGRATICFGHKLVVVVTPLSVTAAAAIDVNWGVHVRYTGCVRLTRVVRWRYSMCVGVCITETISQQPSDAPLSSTSTEDVMSHDGPQPASVQPPIDATSIAPVDQRPIARVSPIMSPTAETTTATSTATTVHMQAASDDGPSALMAVHTNLTSPLQSMTVD